MPVLFVLFLSEMHLFGGRLETDFPSKVTSVSPWRSGSNGCERCPVIEVSSFKNSMTAHCFHIFCYLRSCFLTVITMHTGRGENLRYIGVWEVSRRFL